jgi:spore maturation protein CgeB
MKARRILVMRTGGTIAPYIIDEFAAAFNALNCHAFILDFERMGLYEKADNQAAIKVIKTIKDFAPDFIISYAAEGLIEINGGSGFSHLAEELKIPYCLLFFDAPYRAEKVLRSFAHSQLMKVFCWDRYYFPFFTQCGIKNIHYLPLATNVDTFNCLKANTIEENDISLVGTLNMELLVTQPPASNALLPILQHFLKARLNEPVKNFDELLEKIIFNLCPTEKEQFQQFKASSAFPLFRQDIQRRADALYRYNAIAALSKKHRVCIYGNDGWLAALRENHNAVYKGKVKYGRELAKVYNTSIINLNLTVMQLVHAINQRTFDCPIAGGFLITDYRKDLEELFDINEEIVCFKTIEEMLEKVEQFTLERAKRNSIVEKACKRIIAHHTWQHRAEKILSVLS